MQIYWHGLSSVRIECQHGDTTATLVTDPYGADSGLKFPRGIATDIAVLSNQNRELFPLGVLDGKPFVVADPGEYEVGGVFMYAFPLPSEGTSYPHALAYRFEIEGMSIGFLGAANRKLTADEIGRLENIDILLLPVGGDDRLSAKLAVETMTAIEPRIVIPLYHHIEGLKKTLGTADAFCQEIGSCQRVDAAKLKIARKDLPSEDLIVHVLQQS